MEIEEEEDIIIWLFCRLCYLKAFTCPRKLLKHEAEHHYKKPNSIIRTKRQEVLKDNKVEKDVVVAKKKILPVQREDASLPFTTPTNNSQSSSQSTTVAVEESKMGVDSTSSKSIALFQQQDKEESSSGSRIVYDLVPDSPTPLPELPPCTSQEDVIILEAINDDDSQHSSTNKMSSYFTIDLTREADVTVQNNDRKRDNANSDHKINHDAGLVEIIDKEAIDLKNQRPRRKKARNASNTIEIDLTLQEEDSSDDKKQESKMEDSRNKSDQIPFYEKIRQHEGVSQKSLQKSHRISQHATARKRVRCSDFRVNRPRTPTSPSKATATHSDDDEDSDDDSQVHDGSVLGQRACKRGRPSKRPAICMCHHCGQTYISVKNLEDHVRHKHNLNP